jgi:hypothetical protein
MAAWAAVVFLVAKSVAFLEKTWRVDVLVTTATDI